MVAIMAAGEGGWLRLGDASAILQPDFDMIPERRLVWQRRLAQMLSEVGHCVTEPSECAVPVFREERFETGIDFGIIMLLGPARAHSAVTRTRSTWVLEPFAEPNQLISKYVYRCARRGWAAVLEFPVAVVSCGTRNDVKRDHRSSPVDVCVANPAGVDGELPRVRR